MRSAEWYATVIATDIRPATEKHGSMQTLVETIQREAFDAGAKAAIWEVVIELTHQDADDDAIESVELIHVDALRGRP